MTTGCSLEPNLWNDGTGQAKAACPDAATINTDIARISFELQNIADGFTKQGIDPTMELVREAYKVQKQQAALAEIAPKPALIPTPASVSIEFSFLYYFDKFIQSKNGGCSYAQIRARNKKLRKRDRMAKIPSIGGVFAYNIMKTFYGLYILLPKNWTV